MLGECQPRKWDRARARKEERAEKKEKTTQTRKALKQRKGEGTSKPATPSLMWPDPCFDAAARTGTFFPSSSHTNASIFPQRRKTGGRPFGICGVPLEQHLWGTKCSSQNCSTLHSPMLRFQTNNSKSRTHLQVGTFRQISRGARSSKPCPPYISANVHPWQQIPLNMKQSSTVLR